MYTLVVKFKPKKWMFLDYHLKLIRYRMLQKLDARGERNWVSNVRCELNRFGSGYVWLNQGVEGINQFLHVSFCTFYTKD